jgi:hypothetical protein
MANVVLKESDMGWISCNYDVRTLFGPGSRKGSEEAHDQYEKRVRLHRDGVARKSREAGENCG